MQCQLARCGLPALSWEHARPQQSIQAAITQCKALCDVSSEVNTCTAESSIICQPSDDDMSTRNRVQQQSNLVPSALPYAHRLPNEHCGSSCECAMGMHVTNSLLLCTAAITLPHGHCCIEQRALRTDTRPLCCVYTANCCMRTDNGALSGSHCHTAVPHAQHGTLMCTAA